MKMRFLLEKRQARPLKGVAGMTLVEVVMALAISSLMVGGIISGYNYCTQASVKVELAQAANAKALERLEQTRSAIWAPDRANPVDELLSTNFPSLSVSLDMPGSGSGGTLAQINTTITNLSSTPPTRSIHVDCIWQYRGTTWVTNSVETIRATDQ